jgi:arylsulfatase A-like enzyme
MIADGLRRCLRDPGQYRRYPALVQYLYNQRGRKSEKDYQCARVFRTAADWLEDNYGNMPFFLWVDSFDPHEPWDPPENYADKYMRGYRGLDFIYPGLGGERSAEEDERLKALYFGEITLVDRWVGVLLDKLDALGGREDTLVILTSDHGTQIFDHGRIGKGPDHLHPYNTRLNLYIRHPDTPGGQLIHGLVQAHDIPATALALLGIEHPMEGQNAWPVVMGQAEGIRDYVVIGWARFCNGRAEARVSVRDEGWNYVVGVGYEDQEPELYDLREDPEERNNVVHRYPDVVTMQRKRIEAVIGQPLPGLMNECCDAGPAPISTYLTRRGGG